MEARRFPRDLLNSIAFLGSDRASAHLFPKNKGGTDDPRNGLVFCAAHHRAFDTGLFIIKPRTLTVHCRASGPFLDVLRIKKCSLDHLPKKPHQEALEWCWKRWNETNSPTAVERNHV